MRIAVLLNYWLHRCPFCNLGDKKNKKQNRQLQVRSLSEVVGSESDFNIYVKKINISHPWPHHFLYYPYLNCTHFLGSVTWISILFIFEAYHLMEACWTTSFLPSPSWYSLIFISYTEKYGINNTCIYFFFYVYMYIKQSFVLFEGMSSFSYFCFTAECLSHKKSPTIVWKK